MYVYLSIYLYIHIEFTRFSTRCSPCLSQPTTRSFQPHPDLAISLYIGLRVYPSQRYPFSGNCRINLLSLYIYKHIYVCIYIYVSYMYLHVVLDPLR